MSNKKNIWITIPLVLIVVVFFAVSKNNKTNNIGDKMMEDNSKNTIVGNSMNKEADTIMKDDTMPADTMMSVGSYEDYSPEKISKAASGKVVLFFKASWCPSCNAIDKDIVANLKNIPKDINILKVNYDNSNDLKQKYSVTYQHTFVQVDSNGNMLAKWSGSPTLKNLLSNIK